MRYYTQLLSGCNVLYQWWLHVFLGVVGIEWTIYLWAVIFKSIVATAIRDIFLFHIRLTIWLAQNVAILPIESLICAALNFAVWICESIVRIQQLLIGFLLISTFVIFCSVSWPFKNAKIFLDVASGMTTRERSSRQRIRNRTTLSRRKRRTSTITLAPVRLAWTIVGQLTGTRGLLGTARARFTWLRNWHPLLLLTLFWHSLKFLLVI